MNKLETLKCIEVTSQRQADNGTISYFDPQTKTYYNLYESGYVRRSFGRKRWANGQLGDETIYQLNPTKTVQHAFNRHDGYSYSFNGRSRVMLMTHEERMECAARAVINYRNTSAKYKKRAIEAAQRLKEQRENRYLNMIMLDIQDSTNQYFEGNLSFTQAMNNIKSSLVDANYVVNA
mgnify:FL=1|jgi:hypothetical protein